MTRMSELRNDDGPQPVVGGPDRPLNILFLGINYAPEPVGIGPYSTGLAEYLVSRGHHVQVVTAKPYYPDWRRQDAFSGGGSRKTVENGVAVIRCPIYVPSKPTGLRRILHHLSFAARALPHMLVLARQRQFDLVFTVAPSLLSAPVARLAARLGNARTWVHIQDFEVDAAFATGLMAEGHVVARLARSFERAMLKTDRVSTISPQMCARLAVAGVAPDRIVELRNWASIESIRPQHGQSGFRDEWHIDRRHVALYSGNIANKQGIEIVVEAARLLVHRRDLMFVICGNGANRDRIVALAAGLDNIRFHDLQPKERLSDLLALASVHLLPQIAGAADLVLPSKMANMLASGVPIVTTADRGTGVADEVEGCGIVTPPGDAAAFAAAIEALIDDRERSARLGALGRSRAEERWSSAEIFARLEAQLTQCAHEPGDARRAANAGRHEQRGE